MTIKEAAGKIILLLYYAQTENPAKLDNSKMAFTMINKPKLEADGWLKRALRDINENDAVLYNAINYLLEKRLIARRNTKDTLGGMLLISPHLTADGIDIIEGIEQGTERQRIVKSLFNFTFNLSPTMKVDNLIKAEVGNIVGIGGAISGKVEKK
jgi:hypothetical protein